MTAQLPRIIYRIGNPENDNHFFTDNSESAADAIKNGYEVSEYIPSAHEQEPVAYDQQQRDLMNSIIAIAMKNNLERGDKLVMADIFAATMTLMQSGFRTHPAPVPAVPDAIKWPAEKFCPAEYAGSLLWNETEIWNKAVEACQDAYRAAMLNGGQSERDKVRAAHAEWSQKTFGNVGPVGPLKHLAKEAIEAADAPDDLSEWADMQFLLWDAQRRAGITDEQINLAMI